MILGVGKGWSIQFFPLTDVETKVQNTLLSIKNYVSSNESKNNQEDW